jgi:cytochrome c-type biogenesis protein CcmH/NrfG
MPPPGAGAPPAPPPANEITMLEDLVRRDPNNREAWVRLGNDYFDSHQPQKSIAAYGKALEIKGDDPDVLTDQGVMYREIGMYDNALKNFEKAHQADPKHLTSLFNQGIVWAFDKKDPKKATAVWQEVIKKDPAGPNGQKARDLITQFQSGAPPPAR